MWNFSENIKNGKLKRIDQHSSQHCKTSSLLLSQLPAIYPKFPFQTKTILCNDMVFNWRLNNIIILSWTTNELCIMSCKWNHLKETVCKSIKWRFIQKTRRLKGIQECLEESCAQIKLWVDNSWRPRKVSST